MMELVRHHGARAEQDDLFGEIWLYPGSDKPLDLSRADNYEHRALAEGAGEAEPR
jgi:hypothetical protein